MKDHYPEGAGEEMELISQDTLREQNTYETEDETVQDLEDELITHFQGLCLLPLI